MRRNNINKLFFKTFISVLYFFIILFFGCDNSDKIQSYSQKAEKIFYHDTINVSTVSAVIKNDILMMQPFTNYLTEKFRYNNKQIYFRLTIVPSLNELIELVKSSKNIIYIDSPYPTLYVHKNIELNPQLIHWKENTEYYYSVFFTKKEHGYRSLSDLKGKVVGFDEKYSTSGYFLPIVQLLESNLETIELKSSESMVPNDKIGYIFTTDDENTMFWVLNDKVDAGATDIISFNKYSGVRKNELEIISSSIKVPRQIVSYKNNMNDELIVSINNFLINMESSVEGKKALKEFYSTKKFTKLNKEEFQELDNTCSIYFDRIN